MSEARVAYRAGRDGWDLGLGQTASARSGARGERPRLAMNRSVVRRADAFVVHERWMADRIRTDRNALTPIAVVAHETESERGDERRGWEHLARQYVAALEAFPPARCARRSLRL